MSIQPLLVEVGDLSQSVILPPVRVAGQIAQRFELARSRSIGRSSIGTGRAIPGCLKQFAPGLHSLLPIICKGRGATGPASVGPAGTASISFLPGESQGIE